MPVSVSTDGGMIARVIQGGFTLEAFLDTPNVYNDNQWHTATMVFDRLASTNGTLHLITDKGQISIELVAGKGEGYDVNIWID